MKKFREVVIGLYALAIFGILPLYFRNDYDDILLAKVSFFWITAVVSFTLLLVPAVVWIVTTKNKNRDIAGFFLTWNMTDIAVAAFAVTVLLSTLFSEWRADAVSGRTGWYVGGGMLLCLCLFYFIVSRGKLSSHRYVPVVIIAATIVMILGILNDFWLDPLSMRDTVNYYWKDTFTSTVGNINVFAAYLSIVVPFISMVFVLEKSPLFKTVTALLLFPCYLNMFLTHADGIYIGVGIGMVFVFLYSLKTPNTYLSFLLNGILFGVAGYTTTVLLQIFPKIKMDDVSPVLLGYKVHLIVGGVSFVLILLHMFLELQLGEKWVEKILKRLLVISLNLIIIAFAVGLVYFVFSFDRWTLNRRGTIWIIAGNVFEDGGLKEKLIGLGPCCFDHCAVDYAFEITESYDAYYTLENAHNDFVEYLVTTGLLGFASYLLMFATVMIDFIKNFFRDKQVAAEKACLFMAIAGYFAQAVIYGPHPLTSAICFLFIALYRANTLHGKMI